MDLKSIFFQDLDLSLALEIGLRTFIMFALVLVFLRSSGKKGVRQLSIFEVAIVIALGSAAGDPMLNQDSAILPSALVFLVVLLVYRLITYLAAKNKKIEDLLEGKPMYIIEDGMFTIEEQGDANFAQDEFFAELRAENIEHIGQVRTALLESNGQVSLLFFEPDETKPGMPVYPKAFAKRTKLVTKPGTYCCTHCAKPQELSGLSSCDRCNKDEWVEAMDTLRI